jgi:asparagine synthase (glutamine-hydrolysing)
MWLMARVIKSMGIKMVLSGEGADELWRVFVFPQSTKQDEENVRKLGNCICMIV